MSLCFCFPPSRRYPVTVGRARAARDDEPAPQRLISNTLSQRGHIWPGLVAPVLLHPPTSRTLTTGTVLYFAWEGAELISLNKRAMGSRDSCWGSCFTSSKAFSPILPAWNEAENTKGWSGVWGFPHGWFAPLQRIRVHPHTGVTCDHRPHRHLPSHAAAHPNAPKTSCIDSI